MKGIGCYAWDTPEIVRAKKSYELQSDVSSTYITHIFFMFIFACSDFYIFFLLFYCFKQIKYKAEGKKEFNNYSIVTDTPVYVTAVLGHTWASEVGH